MKQSLRCHLPDIFVEDSLKVALSTHSKGHEIVLADEKAAPEEMQDLSGDGSRFLVVGPEGGFSTGERQLLQQYNPVKVSLGEYRLRAETAAVVMAARYVAS
jgi:16S rRNA (uracil1498-N3)-methyltransferase